MTYCLKLCSAKRDITAYGWITMALPGEPTSAAAGALNKLTHSMPLSPTPSSSASHSGHSKFCI